MAVQFLAISFDDSDANPRAVYRSGQTVGCRVLLKLLEPVKCRSVYVKVFGDSRVCWSETVTTGTGDDERSETVQYQSREEYIDQKIYVFTPETSGPNAEHHPAGKFAYHVTFQIPPTAPTSFEGDVGRIHYYVKANIDRPWKIDDYTQKFFTVIRDLDLNTRVPTEMGPFANEENFNIECCICFDCCFGKVRFSVALPKKGYVPGENIHVTGEIRNTSKTNLEEINLEIYQKTEYLAGNSANTICRVVASTDLPGIAQGRSVQLNHRLPVGSLPNSYLEGCSNIDVKYFFRLHANGGCCLSVKKEYCELVIGTIPLNSSAPQRPQSAAQLLEVQLQQPQPMPSFPPPPSYEECMFGGVQVDKEEGQGHDCPSRWAPSYPMYSLPSAPPKNKKTVAAPAATVVSTPAQAE